MELTWHGHSCFRLTQRRKSTIVTDPYDHKAVGYAPLKLRADVVTVSTDAPGHNYTKAVKGARHILNSPGEYEIGGVFITAIRIDDKETRRNIIFAFDYEDITIAHLGNLKRVPTQAELESLGRVDVALVPVGSGGGLNASQAAEVVSVLEPSIVIPMHYRTPQEKMPLEKVDAFLKEMGAENLKPLPSLKVNKSDLPEEVKVILLEVNLP